MMSFLCVDCIRKYLKEVKFSEKGTSVRVKEEATYMHFMRYLQKCEKSKFRTV